MKTMRCDVCQRDVVVFQQEYTTIPQSDENQIRRYRETFCAYCGKCLERITTDEVAK